MTLRLDPGAADTVASGHVTAAAALDGAAASAPGAVDAGIGTDLVLDLLAACSGTTLDLAGLDLALAEAVRRVGSDLAGTDEVVGDAFARTGGGLR